MTARIKRVFELGSNSTSPLGFSGFEFYLSKQAGTSAVGTLTLTGIPGNTLTVTIGTKVYTFLTTLTQLDGSVLRGATASASIDNLIAAINQTGGAGVLYGAPTVPHPSVIALVAAGDTMTALAKEIGTDGNSIATTETLSNGSWGDTTLDGGSFGNAAQDNNFVITLPTSPQIGVNYRVFLYLFHD